jgi:hypothetical protein
MKELNEQFSSGNLKILKQKFINYLLEVFQDEY